MAVAAAICGFFLFMGIVAIVAWLFSVIVVFLLVLLLLRRLQYFRFKK